MECRIGILKKEESDQCALHQVYCFISDKKLCSKYNPVEPCRDAIVPEPDKLVESSENSLSVHLEGWQDANCETILFMVEQR